MEIFKTITSIVFIITYVFFVVKSLERLKEPQEKIEMLVAITLSTLVALFAIDIMVFAQQHSMRAESRDKILQMVMVLVAGLVAFRFYTNKKNE
jgi:Na+/pantothenate symporter